MGDTWERSDRGTGQDTIGGLGQDTQQSSDRGLGPGNHPRSDRELGQGSHSGFGQVTLDSMRNTPVEPAVGQTHSAGQMSQAVAGPSQYLLDSMFEDLDDESFFGDF